MKYINLSDRTENQVIVDKETDVYIGHPTTALLSDGLSEGARHRAVGNEKK